MRAALILQHGESGPPGLLAEWATDRGIPIEVHLSDLGEPHPALDGRPFIATLGSRYSPVDRHVPEVAAELEFVCAAVAAGTPVLGLCYGGQLLATVLGGSVEHAPQPELGWHRVESTVPDLIAEGPWLQWHYDRFSLPPSAQLLASSPRALQAFSHGPHLGVQFHPESTIEIVQGWARSDGARLAAIGVTDGEALPGAGRHHAAAARTAAFELSDGFWHRARPPERRNP